MDIRGRVSRGSYCPAGAELLEYARKVYVALAEAEPDFIWLDDDIRLAGHGPVAMTCFCDGCLERFSKESGRRFTRESLQVAFDGGSLEERLGWRRRWLEHNRATLDGLFQVIERAVHGVRPGLELGFMTGDRFFEGYDFERWARTLSGPARAAVRWRPGGGFYSDEKPLDLVDKANALGRQVAALPEWVAVIQSEIENFPYQRLRKAEHTTVVEAAADMAAGTTGSAYNVLTMTPDGLEEYDGLGRKIEGSREFHAELKKALGRGRTEGLWPAWHRDLQVTVNVDGEWLAPGRLPLAEPYTWGEIGIPMCYDAAGRAATALSRQSVLAFSKDELREIFRGGVVMDAEAWQAMERLGLAGWTGVKVVKGYDVDATERLTGHALNGRFAGWGRDCRQSFYKERAWALQGGAALSVLVDYGGKLMGTAMTAFENQLGGRVVVMGYYPWSQVHSLAKSTQLKAVVDWVARRRMPAMVETYSKVVIWKRGKGLVLLNASLDEARDVTVRWAGAGGRVRMLEMGGARRELGVDEGGRVRVPPLGPWSICLLTK
jgi:hypothetical protein